MATINHQANFETGTLTNLALTEAKGLILDQYLEEWTEERFTNLGNYSSSCSGVAQDDEFIYFTKYSTSEQNDAVIKVRKSNFQKVAEYKGTACMDIICVGDYLYVARYATSNDLVKLDKNLSFVAQLTCNAARRITLDTNGQFLYVTTYASSYNRMHKIRLSDFTNLGNKIGHYWDVINSTWQDDNYVYATFGSLYNCPVTRWAKDLSANGADCDFTTTNTRYSRGGFCKNGNVYVFATEDATSGGTIYLYKRELAQGWTNGNKPGLLATFSNQGRPNHAIYDGSKYVYLTWHHANRNYRIVKMDVSGAEAGWNMDTYLSIGITQSFNYADYTRKQLVVATGERVVLVDLEVDFAEDRYYDSGTYVSPEIDLSSLPTYGGSVTTEAKTVPAGSTAILEAAYYQDGAWGEYVAVSEDMLKNWEAGYEFNETSKLKYRITITKATYYSSPVYSSLNIYIEEAGAFAPIFIIRDFVQWALELYDSDFKLLAEVNDYEFLNWRLYYQDAGSFEMHITEGKTGATNLFSAKYAGLTRQNETRLCEISKLKRIIDEKTGITTWRSYGFGIELMLKARAIMASGGGFFEAEDYTETLIKRLISENMGAGAEEVRRLHNLVIANDKKLGSVQTLKERLSYIWDVAYRLLGYEQLGHKMTFNKTTKEVIYDIYSGEDHSAGQSKPVVFSYENKNINGLQYEGDESFLKNVGIIAAKEDELGVRATSIIGDSAGWNRKELLIDAGKYEETSLITYGGLVLQKFKRTDDIQFSMSEQGVYEMDRDFVLGDIVSVVVGDLTLDKRVTGLHIVSTPKNQYYRYEIGEKTGILDPIARQIELLEGKS